MRRYPQDEIEVVIADGMSNDGTRDAIRVYASQHPELSIRPIDNPQRIIPAGLISAIKVAKEKVIIRLDMHLALRPTYIERCLAALEEMGAANVGGVWESQPGGGDIDGVLDRGLSSARRGRRPLPQQR